MGWGKDISWGSLLLYTVEEEDPSRISQSPACLFTLPSFNFKDVCRAVILRRQELRGNTPNIIHHSTGAHYTDLHRTIISH